MGLKIILATFLFFVLAGSGNAFCDEPRLQPRRLLASDLRPRWASSQPSQSPQNESYLSDRSQNLNVEALGQLKLLENQQLLELKQQYEDLNRDYQMRQVYGLVDTQSQIVHQDQVSDFGRQIFGRVRENQQRLNAERLKSASNRDDTIKAVEQPAAVAGTLVAVYSGEPMGLKISNDMKLTTITNVGDKAGQLHLESPLMDARVDVRAAAPASYDPTQGERFRLSLSRPLELWDLRSGLSYGSSSTNLSASLAKPLTEHLTAVLDSIHPLSSDVQLSQEQRLSLLYGIHF